MLKPLVTPLYYALLKYVCGDGILVTRSFLKINQWNLMLTVFSAAALARLLTGSWIIALVVATMLFSRGHLLGNISKINADGLLMWCFATWFAALVHFFKTGSKLSLAGLLTVSVLGVLTELSYGFLLFTVVIVVSLITILRRSLLRPTMRRFRNERRRARQRLETVPTSRVEGVAVKEAIAAGIQWLVRRGFSYTALTEVKEATTSRFLGSLNKSFAHWILRRRRWVKLIIACSLTILAGFLFHFLLSYLSFGGGRHWESLSFNLNFKFWGIWLRDYLAPVDLHYGASVLIVGLCALQSPASGLVNFFETVWTLLLAIVIISIAALLLDTFDVTLLTKVQPQVNAATAGAWLRCKHVLVWFEPIVLSMGVMGLYQLIVIGEQMTVRRRSEILSTSK